MSALGHDRFAARLSLRRWLKSGEGSSLAEFAISLPLLVVLVVGIFDFGGAFNLKQELNNAVREGARFGASQPTNDLCPGSTGCTAPASVDAIRVLVDSYLVAARLNDCGLSTVSAPSGSSLTWTYKATGCTPNLFLTIARGYSGCSLTATYPNVSQNVNIPCTQVSISYPYQWHFNSVIQLIVPGSGFTPFPITTWSTVANMD